MVSKDAPLSPGGPAVRIPLAPPASRVRTIERGRLPRTRARPATGSHANAVLILPDNNRDPELTQVLKDAQQKYFAGKRRRQQAPNRAPALTSKIKLTGREGGPRQTKQTIDVPPDDDHDPLPPTSDRSG